MSGDQDVPSAGSPVRHTQAVPLANRQVELLSRIGVFQLLSPLLLADVAKMLERVDVEPDQVIVREGDPGDGLYVIEQGTFLVETLAGDRAQVVARLGPQEFFGEMALLTGDPRSATVRAETAGRLWRLDAASFQRLVDEQLFIAEAFEAAVRLRTRQEYSIEHVNLAPLLAERQEVRIGRHPDNDLVLDSRVVSAHHALVRRIGDAFQLTDLGSSNGTFVNGAQVNRAELKDGDQIWLADQRLMFDRRDLQRVVEPQGIRIDARGLKREVRGGKNLLQDISLSILPGEFVAIVGGSGAGKSTLMDALSGVHRATGGQVLYSGADYYSQQALYRTTLGYVPQDDIIHKDLPLRVTLTFAAKLRLPRDTTVAERDEAVDQSLEQLGLTAHADTQVGQLSGGQRKRASIGVELLTRPRVFFLDEPTSGLDPATDGQMMTLLRDLARSGSTVVLTTHATKNVMLCDKVVFLARGGHVAFAGPPTRALQYFDVESFDEIYTKLDEEDSPEEWGARYRASEDHQVLVADGDDTGPQAASTPVLAVRPGNRLGVWMRQFAVLSQRNAELYLRNPGRVIPLFVQPVAFALMLIALFRTGLFEVDTDNPTAAMQMLFILSFTCFLFGLLYGIQEIVKEFPIFRRERLVNLGVLPYLLSKTVFLAPVLVIATLIMTVGLWATDRLPDAGFEMYGPLTLTLVLTAFVGLSLALLTSAAANTSQTATDLLSVWIMPQVLFSGAIFPVPSMNLAGRVISNVISLRWSFEGAGQVADLPELFVATDSAIGASLLLQYEESFGRVIWQNWLILGAFIVVPMALAWFVLWRRTAQ